MEIRPVLMIIGVLTATLGCSMFLPAIADALVGNPDWIVFVTTGSSPHFWGQAHGLRPINVIAH